MDKDTFNTIRRALHPDGAFASIDVVGRNGHMRWPEALALIERMWQFLPDQKRYHTILKTTDAQYQNRDCSNQGFEGIRSQDILPLCVERFGFDLFVGFANVVDPFVDRGFGHHFDATSERDRAFIDRVHERDEREILARRITPTHMFAVMRAGEGTNDCSRGLSPREAIRTP